MIRVGVDADHVDDDGETTRAAIEVVFDDTSDPAIFDLRCIDAGESPAFVGNLMIEADDLQRALTLATEERRRGNMQV